MYHIINVDNSRAHTGTETDPSESLAHMKIAERVNVNCLKSGCKGTNIAYKAGT